MPMPIRFPAVTSRTLPLALASLFAAAIAQPADAQEQQNPAPGAPGVAPRAANPYRLQPFHADFPVELEYPPQVGLEYARTRRQILERLASNLQGNVRR